MQDARVAWRHGTQRSVATFAAHFYTVDMFDTAFGLPIHPLLVHLPVVLLPLVAVGVILVVIKKDWRARFAVPLLALLAIGALGAVGAMLSGNALAVRVGVPAQHQQLGLMLAIAALLYLVLAGGWLLWARRESDSPAKTVTGWIAAAASIGIIVLTVLTGHSGASAAWSGTVAEPAPTLSATAEPAPPSSTSSAPSASAEASASSSTTPSASASATASYTMAQVQEHNSAESCWAAIDGNVYDLTNWITQHPGGESAIIGLCGTDATSAFESRHSGDQRPADELASLLLGPLQS